MNVSPPTQGVHLKDVRHALRGPDVEQTHKKRIPAEGIIAANLSAAAVVGLCSIASAKLLLILAGAVVLLAALLIAFGIAVLNMTRF